MNGTSGAPLEVPLLIDGQPRTHPSKPFAIVDPYRQRTSALVHEATASDIEDAVAGARAGALEMERMPAHQRGAILRRTAAGILARRDEIAERIVWDVGKCLRDARGEIDRAIEVFSVSSEEATRIGGEVVPLDGLPLGEGVRLAVTLRQPVGVVLAIGPFNAPIQILAHKLGPAFAGGNAVVCKPARQGSAVALILAAIMREAGLPTRALQVVHGGAAVVDPLVAHRGVDLVNFTGSGRVGEAIIRRAGLKRVILELGGNAGVIIHEDAAWEKAAAACVAASYGIAGQSCVSLQRLYVHRSLFDRVAGRFAELSAKLKQGDTLSADTEVGVMIDLASAERVKAWIDEAIAGGARALCGGGRDRAAVQPTVLVDVTDRMKVVCEEVFGPVVSLIPYDDIDAALDAVNDSPWGLASGVFSGSLDVALKAARRLRTGIVNVNGPSRYRVEHVAYGGLKQSGWGKEGPRYAIQEMTDLKTVIFSAS